MAIYAFGTPNPEAVSFIRDSLIKEKISRFLFSYHDCDLNRLKNLSWDKMDDDEKKSWSHAHRLLEIVPGDWIMHINVPKWGEVTAAHVTSGYFYQDNLPDGHNDGRYCFHVDEVFTFGRNDNRVHPEFSSRLKLRGALWRIYCEDAFEETMKNLKNKTALPQNHYLNKEIEEFLNKITERIHKNNPGKQLETFLANIFRNVPGVTNVIENGSGWGTDYGADLIITYNSKIIGDLTDEKTMVVQVKSYEGEHWDKNAVHQLEDAIEKFNASSGMIITTGKRTEALEKKFNEVAEKMKEKNVSMFLLADIDVSKFILKYWKEYSSII